MKKVSFKKDFQKNWPLYLMFLPLFLYFVVFNYIPMGGILMAFEKYSVSKGIFGSEWVGMKNFVTLFTGDGFLIALRNTVCIAVLNSAVVVCALVREFLKDTGAITGILSALGFERQNWLANVNIPVFWIIYVLIGVWVGTGYGSIVYTTSISNVNNDLKEAAALDGANRWDRIVHIVIPSVMPLAMMMLTLSVGTVFMVGWDKILLLYMPKTYQVSDVLYTYTYRTAFGQTVNFGLSTASGLFQSVVGTILLLISNALNKKVTSYSLF